MYHNHLIKHYIPDVIILKDSKPEAVFDVKFKNRLKPDRNDTHQLMSYVLMLGVNKCGFIFPKSQELSGGLVFQDELNVADDVISYYEIEYDKEIIASSMLKVGCGE